MSENDDLKRQIAQLQSAINKRKSANVFRPPGGPIRYSAFRPHPTYNRYSPTRPAIRPLSRNIKLVVKPESSKDSAAMPDAETTTKFITTANKLVRVGSGAPTISPIRPLARPPVFSREIGKSRKIDIDGETYIRKGRGNKLVLASAASHKPASNAKSNRIVDIEGEPYIRTKRGSLIRVAALRSLRKKRTLLKRPPKRPRRLCTKFLYKKCEKEANECRFSHSPTPETVPLCHHFLRDMCTKSDCIFLHSKVSPNAPICREFVYKGYCPKGSRCQHRHVWECPDWVEKGKCAKKKCKLPHPPPRKCDSDKSTKHSQHSKEALTKAHKRRPLLYMNFAGESAENPDEMSDLASLLNNAEDSSGDDDDDDNINGEDDDHNENGSGGDDDLESDLSGDEADELLKWYDDNYIETED